MHGRLALALSTVALLAAAPSAVADTLAFQGSTLVYSAAPGEENQVTAMRSNDCGDIPAPCVRISASVNLVPSLDTFDPQCKKHPTYDDIACPVPTSITYNLGDRDDQAHDWDGASTINGGSGADLIEGNAGNDVIDAGPDDDFLIGGPGDDQLQGGLGNDYLENMANTYDSGDPAYTAGTDRLAGGPGVDTLSYKGRSDALSITINAAADDGAPGEGDYVDPDIEVVAGAAGNDTLTGDGGPNALYGLDGADTIHGGAGDDTVDGGPGNDSVFGDEGVDKAFGGDGADVVDGGPGPDTISGDAETACLLSPCFEGADDIRARDGEVDTINCFGGTDAVVADAADVFPGRFGQADCESIDRPAAGPAPGGGTTTTPTSGTPTTGAGGAPVTTIARVTFAKAIGRRALLRRGLPLSVRCSAACRVTARLLAGRRVVGSKTGRRAQAGTLRLRVKITKKGRRLLGRRRSLTLSITDAAGTAMRLTVKVRG